MLSGALVYSDLTVNKWASEPASESLLPEDDDSHDIFESSREETEEETSVDE